ncbi:hypothetical protein CSA56_11130 [candidate division KSB3 bacterium]|uniref:Peptidase S55 domain-containing protein n=1 Tax=candidate division KSB3 bacterium TaxID=2044937 RepID=A0A2G6KDA7_9BACT|nr:MAG: hypothetical protein CSA56_11130 [candidate division KSB3 bacterium]
MSRWKYLRGIIGLIIGCIGSATAFGADESLLMPVDDIRPGMKGIGKTVFAGTTIEEFDVEILGVLKNRTPHGDAIMAKVTGGPLPLEESGVLAGMSGSPIYIDGKLIGALAFIPAIFPKEPLAGITPIHQMLRDAEHVQSVADASFAPFVEGVRDHESFQFRPIRTPCVVSGVAPQSMAFLEEQLLPFGMTAVQGGSASQALIEEINTELQPGSAVGVQFIRGDMNASGVGTVTFRDQDKIIAFGHPMFGGGTVNFPMTTAYVHLTISTLINSFKLASSLETVGAITEDRLTGISGIVGQEAPMVPLDVVVSGNGKTHHYAFEIVDHPLFTPLFMKVASFNALQTTERSTGAFTISTKLTIEFEDAQPLVVEEQFTGKSSPVPVILGAFSPLDTLTETPLSPIAFKRVSLEMNVTDQMRFAEIIGLRVGQDEFSPGEQIEAAVTLRPYGEKPFTVKDSLVVPEGTLQGRFQLFACDAKGTSTFEALRAQAKFHPQTVEQLHRILREKISSNTVALTLFQVRPGVVVQGQELPSPPVSMLSMVSSIRRSTGKNSLTQGQIVAHAMIPTQYTVAGCASLEVLINGHLKKDTVEEPIAEGKGEEIDE